MKKKVTIETTLTDSLDQVKSLEKTIKKLSKENEKHLAFFENSPIALWIEDFSEVKKYIDKVSKGSNTDVRSYIANNPNIIPKLQSLIVIKEVNATAVSLYKAKNKQDLIKNISKVFTAKSTKGFTKLLIDILSGKKQSTVETVNKTLDGEEISVFVKFNVEDGSEKTLKNIIVFIEDITERAKSQKELEEREKRYKLSQKIAKIGTWDYDFSTNKLRYSDETYKIAGIVKPEEHSLSLESYLSFVHEEDRERVGDFSVNSLLNKPNQTLRYRIFTQQGELKYIQEKRSVVIENDKIVRLIGIGQDITEMVLSEKKLNATKNILANTLSSIADGFVILDYDSNYIYVNNEAEKLLGKKAKELIGKNIWTEFPEKKGDLFFDNFQKAIKTRKPVSFENYFAPWNRWFENRIIPSKDGVLVFFHEITDKKNKEEKIRAAYDIINKSHSVAVLSRNELNFPVEFASENTLDLTGYSHNDFLNNKVKIYEIIHPEDLEAIVTGLYKLNESSDNNNFIPKPFRIITKDKLIKWVQTNFYAIRNKQHKITHIQGIVEDITERKKAEDLFFESNHRLKEQFNNTPLGSIMWDKNFNVIEWNNSAQRIFGYTAKEAKTCDLKNLITPPHLISEIKEIIDNLLIEKGKHKNTNENITKSGKIITCDWYNVTLKDIAGNVIGVASLVDDITERIKKEEQEGVLYNISKAALTIGEFENFSLFVKNELHKLIDTSNFYIALYNKESDMITTPIFVDDKEKIQEFSAKNTLTGYVIKTKKSLMVNEESQKRFVEEGKIGQVGEFAKIWLGVPLKIHNKVFGAIVVQSYVNENAYNESDVQLLEFVADQISTTIQRKNAENELKRALAKAQESDRLKSSFLANMSHEIRTPMNGIIGFSELFLEPDLSDIQRTKYAKIVINSSKQLLSIVNDILDISKIEAGVVKLNYESVNINKLLDELNTFYKPRAEENKLELRCVKGLENLESIIKIDKIKLNQVLTNLLSNAFKFTEKGSIEYGYQLLENKLQFYVKDTGIGIEESIQDKIFDRFIQVNIDLNKKLQGTGLGLAISKKFIELFKGEIWVDSNSEGCTMYFTIPYIKSTLPIKTSVVEKRKIESQKLIILVVEDEEYNMMYINELFSKTNFKIIEADNGKKAVELEQEHPEIDLVLMDIKMPVMDGNEAMRLIKKKRPLLPVIALSAFAMESDKQEALKNGFDAYLTKPINKNELFSVLEKYANNT